MTTKKGLKEMTLKNRLKKIEQKINLSDKSQFDKYTIVQYMTDEEDSEEVKEAKKQEAIENKINQIADELNISNDRAKQIFDSIDVKFSHIRLVD